MELVIEFIKSDLFLACLGYILTAIMFVIKIIKDKKQGKIEQANKEKEELKVMLTSEIIPLMEQAELTFDNAEEKDNWVIKKLSEATHIDFYKYKNILEIAENIITDICKTTKINVNKIKVVEQQEVKEEKKEELTNGVF